MILQDIKSYNAGYEDKFMAYALRNGEYYDDLKI